MTHIDGKGMNILEENIKRLKELFPEIVTEGKVDFDTSLSAGGLCRRG